MPDEQMSLKLKKSLYNLLMQKMNVILCNVKASGESKINRDFFFVTIPNGVTAGDITFKTIDLAVNFDKDLTDFCETNGLKAFKTSYGYLFGWKTKKEN